MMISGFETFLFSTILFCPFATVFSGAGECRRYIGARTLECYDCDSRYDPYCEHIDRTNLTALKPRVKPCQGCCVKFYHKYPDRAAYIQRTCTEHIIINYFMVDHVCMSEGKARGKMCFCEDNLCNGDMPTIQASQAIESTVPFLFFAQFLVTSLFT